MAVVSKFMSPTNKTFIVLYQGTCRFCNWCREFVLSRSAFGRFEFVAIESERGGTLIRELDLDVTQEHPASIVILGADFAPKYKWQASLEISKHLSWYMRLLRLVLLLVPNSLGNALYDWIGRHRGLMCQIVRCRN